MAKQLESVLIAGITPYFLDKGCVWFEQNKQKLLSARKFQSFFDDNIIFAEKGQEINFYEFLRKIDELGYEKTQRAEEMGEFSSQGGIVEIFPINMKEAVRFDFLGNRIDAIEIMDTNTESEEKAKKVLKKRLKSQKIYSDLKNIKPGDYLVHLDHGIALFAGIEKLQDGQYYLLEYAQGDKLYVPLGLERKLSRFVGFSEPKISRLSSPLWQITKRKIKEDSVKLAKELLEMEAERRIAKRKPFLPDDEFDRQIASAFKYEETVDQLAAIEDIKNDLEKEKPMDRLVAGDVGFGKTEVALRAALKVAKSGSMAVVLAPTAILANQHYNNFKERLKNIPINLALLSRLQGKKERERIMEDLKQDKIDIIIGTHALLSKNILPLLFKKDGRGLLIIDDEQRFGVKQKERLKQMKAKLDVLYLSATPIPRTLHLAMSSLKDISLIQMPPEGRLPIETHTSPWSEETIKEAIKKEIERNGQIYYLHNRISTIGIIKKNVERIIPGIRISVLHSQLSEKDTLKTITDFQNKKSDILMATTIIENGIDLPNVNTLIADNAENLGLSQTYQLKGRIGRSDKKGFAYFFHKDNLPLKAKMRLEALKEMQELGSGYRIALRDMEIRGAGNILGKEQSGTINKVGLNLYCQMLADSVEKLKEF